jgi:hypothetical protein
MQAPWHPKRLPWPRHVVALQDNASAALLTPEQQIELAGAVKAFLRIKSVEHELKVLLKRKPTLNELALAMNCDPL